MRNVNECCTILVKNLIKENFMEKEKKKPLNVLTFFFFSFPIKMMLKLS